MPTANNTDEFHPGSVGPSMTVEQLEARQFLSVTAHQHFWNLIVQGTGHPDHISLEFTPSKVDGDTIATVRSNGKIIWGLARGNNALIPYPKRFVIRGGGGGDHLTVSGKRADARVIVRGGLGNDKILLSSVNGFPARIYGNQGNDTIRILGNRAPDYHVFSTSQWGYLLTVHGNAGNDIFEILSQKVRLGFTLLLAHQRRRFLTRLHIPT